MNDKFKIAGIILWSLTLIFLSYVVHLRKLQLEEESKKLRYHLTNEQVCIQNSFIIDTMNNHQMVQIVLPSYNDEHSYIYIHKTDCKFCEDKWNNLMK